MHVRFEDRSSYRFGAICINAQKFRGHVTLAMPPFQKNLRGHVWTAPGNVHVALYVWLCIEDEATTADPEDMLDRQSCVCDFALSYCVRFHCMCDCVLDRQSCMCDFALSYCVWGFIVCVIVYWRRSDNSWPRGHVGSTELYVWFCFKLLCVRFHCMCDCVLKTKRQLLTQKTCWIDRVVCVILPRFHCMCDCVLKAKRQLLTRRTCWIDRNVSML